jgi:hypothetical protein
VDTQVALELVTAVIVMLLDGIDVELDVGTPAVIEMEAEGSGQVPNIGSQLPGAQ